MLTAALLIAATAAGVTRPERLTAGPSDQLLGVLGPGGRLFYVDNDAGPLSIKSLEPGTGAAGLLLDDAADATAPRPSRDGRRLLYISHQTSASGQLCVREFDAKGAPQERKCLSAEGEAVYQADWLPGGDAIAALVRTELGGDFTLVRYSLSGERTPLLPDEKNLGSPAVSPDGKWIAFVRLQRISPQVSPTFASDAARELTLRRLDNPSAPAVKLAFDLPGATAFPAFSADGKSLYFTQFLNDTALDGVIDGNDNGVLFRVPFDGAAHAPEQLTSAEWNCQYPAPAADRLIATCLFEGSLHVYSLPLDGAIAPGWSRERLDDQLTASRSRWESLLLLARRATIEPAADHARTLFRMIELHLGLGELESAEFYAKQVERTSPPLAKVLLELVAHRHAEASLARGELSETFIADARERLKRLEGTQGDPSTAAFAKVVASEIHDVLGERAQATALLSAIKLQEVKEPFVLHLAAERAAEAGRDLASRAFVLDVERTLSAHPSLEERDRLEFADRFVRWLVRGRSAEELPRLLDQPGVDPASELGFRLELERRLLGLTPQAQEEVRAKIFELYRANKGYERRRALIETTVRRAAREDNDYVLYQFADTWVSFVKPEQAERKPAEDLYRQVVLERAYIEGAGGKIADARGHFFGVTLQTDALEAHIGFIEERLREGHTEASILDEYAKRYAGKADEPVHQFARAWLLARAKGREEQARDLLRQASRTLWARYELQQLWGYVAHQEFLRTGNKLAAEEAQSHYVLGLDLAREAPRARAALLSDLAFLQSRVGNFAIAIRYYDEREKLPFIEPLAELRHRLEKARTLFHLDRRNDALRELDGARKFLDAHPDLGRFRPLLLDRAALYHLDAHKFAEARALYDQLSAQSGLAPRTQFTTRLGRAAAALGLKDASAVHADLDAAEGLFAAASTPATEAAQRMLLLGLRAQAHALQGNWDGALTAAGARRDLLAARYKKAAVDEDALDLALVEGQLAEWSWRKKDTAAARAHLEAAFAHADAWSASTGTKIFPIGLQLLESALALHFDGGVAFPGAKLAERAKATQDQLARLRNPDWVAARERLTTWMTRLELEP